MFRDQKMIDRHHQMILVQLLQRFRNQKLKVFLPLLPRLLLLIPLTHVSLVQKIFHLRLVILLGLILVMLLVDNMCYQIGLLGVNQQKHMNLPFKPKLNIQ